jgi:LPS sulfotransferase NodH
MVPTHTYLICATQRSGSTLLCELLKQTGVAGRPEEYFEAQFETGVPPHPRRFLEGLPITGAGVRANVSPPEAPAYSSLYGITSYREHLERTFELGTTANGVFGAKLMFNQLSELTALAGTLPEYAGLGSIATLRALFGDPTLIWVSRGDKVRQAVSMWKALQSRSWRGERADSDPRGSGHRAPPGGAVYSYDGIDHLVKRFEVDDLGWNDFFAVNELEPLKIAYEDLARDRIGTIRTVLSLVGAALPEGWEAPDPIRRQGDAISDEWVAAYHRDRAERGQADSVGADAGTV